MATKRQYPELWDELIELTKNDEMIEQNISRIRSLSTVFYPKQYQYVRTKESLRGIMFIAEHKKTKERILFTGIEPAGRTFGINHYLVRRWIAQKNVKNESDGFRELCQYRYIPVDKSNFNRAEWNGEINEL